MFHIDHDGVIKYLHCNNLVSDGQNLNLFITEIDSLPLWGALLEYRVKEKAKLYHVILYHHQRVMREMCDAKALGYYWNYGEKNSSDIIDMYWRYPQVWHLLKPLLFYYRYTSDLVDDDEKVEVKQRKIHGSLESL